MYRAISEVLLGKYNDYPISRSSPSLRQMRIIEMRVEYTVDFLLY